MDQKRFIAICVLCVEGSCIVPGCEELPTECPFQTGFQQWRPATPEELSKISKMLLKGNYETL